MLRRLQIVYKRGQVAVHSPDLLYNQKLAAIRVAQQESREHPGKVVFLYEDEHSFFRQPSLACDYAAQGPGSKTARLYAGADAMRRVAGCLDIASGAVITMQRNHFAVPQMLSFFQYVETQYPDAQVIYMALDNWKVHFEPAITQALQAATSRIRFLRLPTYAPWTNPIEKVWRLFCQDFEHLHPFSTRWKELRDTVDAWFEAIRPGSTDLLHTVGLHSHPYSELIC